MTNFNIMSFDDNKRSINLIIFHFVFIDLLENFSIGTFFNKKGIEKGYVFMVYHIDKGRLHSEIYITCRLFVGLSRKEDRSTYPDSKLCATNESDNEYS